MLQFKRKKVACKENTYLSLPALCLTIAYRSQQKMNPDYTKAKFSTLKMPDFHYFEVKSDNTST